jgi:hypothetical protein
MKVYSKNLVFFTAIFFALSAAAECPKTIDGKIDYDSIPVLAQDSESDSKSPAPTYYYNNSSSDWDLVDTGSGYSISTTDLFEIISLGICIDDGFNVQGDAMHMRAALKNYPLSYKNGIDSKSYITGSGPLGTNVGIPEDFHGFMVFSFANSALLNRGAPVYSMVVEMDYSKGATMINAISEGFPKSFYILKSSKTVSSAKEFNSYKPSSNDTMLSTFKGQPSTLNDFPEIDPTTGEVATAFAVEQGLKEFKAATGIGKNTAVLLKVSTFTAEDAASTGILASSKKKKFSTVARKLYAKDSTPSKKTRLRK